VILIGAVVLGRFAVNRLLGLILLGGVVLKLYLSDVWCWSGLSRDCVRLPWDSVLLHVVSILALPDEDWALVESGKMTRLLTSLLALAAR